MRLKVARKSFPVLVSSLLLASYALVACGDSDESDDDGVPGGAPGAGMSGASPGGKPSAGSGGSAGDTDALGGAAGSVGGAISEEGGESGGGNEPGASGSAGADGSDTEAAGASNAGAGGSASSTGGLELPFLGDGGFGGAVAGCISCVTSECPSVLTCLSDTECVAAVACGATSCGAPNAAAGLACWLGCFDGNAELALSVAPALTCAIENCGTQCGSLSDLIEP